MRYLCIGYGDKEKMDAAPPREMKEFLHRCVPCVEELNRYPGLIMHEALSWAVTTLRPVNGRVTVTDGPFVEAREQMGSYFVIEAADLNKAILVASKHPSANIGEQFGCRVEVRPIGEFRPD